ncbi:MAG: OadG family protein [Desulfobulbaceae bacterium]|nr:OadG family protein [Desulfobulbaceae bacterium]
MVGEGLKLMVLGMGIVFVFLTLLVVIMHANARLLRGATEREMQAPVDLRTAKHKAGPQPKAKTEVKTKTDEQQRLVAVIAAALAAHRAKHQ